MIMISNDDISDFVQKNNDETTIKYDVKITNEKNSVINDKRMSLYHLIIIIIIIIIIKERVNTCFTNAYVIRISIYS